MLRVRCKAYLPDFSLAFEHFCIHTGGRGVLDELEKQLKLSPEHMAPSRAALWRCAGGRQSVVLLGLAPATDIDSGGRCCPVVWRDGACRREVYSVGWVLLNSRTGGKRKAATQPALHALAAPSKTRQCIEAAQRRGRQRCLCSKCSKEPHAAAGGVACLQALQSL